ncbi:MAG TPA: cell division protein FtsZ, partial [Candidatus Parcubacteria bacterium]|nr:cell division protein FtsZ [Candidatus Parcubacteria bacterium]
KKRKIKKVLKKRKKTKKAKKRKIKKVLKKRKKTKKAKKRKVKARKTVKRSGLEENKAHKTKIRIIGIGGGAGTIISEIALRVKKVDFIAANTDLQALKSVSRLVKTFNFGQNLTHGLGCGMDWKIGQRAAKEEEQRIVKLFKGVDLCILVASLGGGTSSGAAPQFAKIARDLGVMTFGIFTLPFKFEGEKKYQIAKNSLERLAPNLNVLQVFPNERIFRIIDKKTPLQEAFSAVNQKLVEGLEGLIEMIYSPGLINIDFADLKAILDGRGKLIYLNSTMAQGPNRAEEAARKILLDPLSEYSFPNNEDKDHLEGGSFTVDKILFNIYAGRDLRMKEVEEISKTICDSNKRAKIIFGIAQDNKYNGKIKITLLATGSKSKRTKKKPKQIVKIETLPPPVVLEKKKRKRTKRRPKRKPKTTEKPKKSSHPKKKKSKKPALKRKKKPLISKSKKSASRLKPKTEIVPVILPSSIENKTEPKESTNNLKVRRSALDLKKDAKEMEEKILEEEKKWDVPAFLRKRIPKIIDDNKN